MKKPLILEKLIQALALQIGNEVIFHELAHQVLYVKDDTAFNESFATAVERLGSAAWLADPAHAAAQREYADLDTQRQEWRRHPPQCVLYARCHQWDR